MRPEVLTVAKFMTTVFVEVTLCSCSRVSHVSEESFASSNRIEVHLVT